MQLGAFCFLCLNNVELRTCYFVDIKGYIWPLYFLNGCMNSVFRVGLVFLTVACLKFLNLWCHLKMIKPLRGGGKSEVFLGKGYWDLSLHLSCFLECCLTYCELFTMTLCLPIGSEGIDAPPFRLIICYILLQCQRVNSPLNRMKQYEIFWAWILVSKKHFQFIHLVEEISILLPFSYCCKYVILWIPQAALSTNCWSMLLSVWEKGVSSCTEVLGECMFPIHFSKYLDMGFSGQMQSFSLLYRKLLNGFICVHAHNVGVFCCTTLQCEHQLLYSAWCYQV